MKKVQTDLRAPGQCVICLGTRVHGEEFMVDTEVDNDTPVITGRTGRIYVCNYCVRDMAKECGFVHEDTVERERADFVTAREEVRKFREELRAAFAGVEEVANRADSLDVSLASREAEQEGR